MVSSRVRPLRSPGRRKTAALVAVRKVAPLHRSGQGCSRLADATKCKSGGFPIRTRVPFPGADRADMNTPRNDTELPRDATEVSAPRRPLPQLGGAETELDEGDRLGAWRLVRRLAKGGMGAVYLAERADGHFEQRAAIKLIRGVPSAD